MVTVTNTEPPLTSVVYIPTFTEYKVLEYIVVRSTSCLKEAVKNFFKCPDPTD